MLRSVTATLAMTDIPIIAPLAVEVTLAPGPIPGPMSTVTPTVTLTFTVHRHGMELNLDPGPDDRSPEIYIIRQLAKHLQEREQGLLDEELPLCVRVDQ